MKLDARVTEPEPGSGVGFRAPPAGTASNDDFVEVFLTNEDGRGLSLQFWWWPNDNRTLRDGDRYKLVMTAGGVRTVFLDELAKYSDSSLGAPGTPCYQHCALFQDDRRGKGLPHQGGEDAGM